MNIIENILEIKKKLNNGEKLNLTDTDVILLLINKYEFGIKTSTETIDELNNLYNPNLHGWQYEAQISFTVSKIKEVTDSFL